MSTAIAVAYLEKVKNEQEYREKIAKSMVGNSPEDLLDVAAADGYQFSLSDLQAASEEIASRQMASGAELSEEELELVAGGARHLTVAWGDDQFFTICF